MTAYYFENIKKFLNKDTDDIVGKLSEKQTRSLDLNVKQNESWKVQINLFKESFKKTENLFDESPILIEYALLRLSKRIDTIILYKNVVIVIEFKRSSEFLSSDKNQLEDYCLNLKYFHEESNDKFLIPILLSSNAMEKDNVYKMNDNNIAETLYANKENFHTILKEIIKKFKNDKNNIDPKKWNESIYKPVPTIIEAAHLLYSGHNVREIACSKSSTKNIAETTEELVNIINESKKKKQKSICFVTGVPGSGKTLTGLNAVHDPRFQKLHGIYLSGNTPLIKVLIASLKHNYSKIKKCTVRDAEFALKSQIQAVNTFLKEYIERTSKPPHEHVIVFDEAQRAWDAEQGQRKFDHKSSEPEMFLQLMERHKDWSVIIALVGNGQEINTGERGLVDWGESLYQRAKSSKNNWKIYISPEMLSKSEDKTFNKLVDIDKENILDLIENKNLHLPVSVRSIVNEESINFINSLIDEDFKSIDKNIVKDLPIYLTRSLKKMRLFLKNKVIGNQRCGLVSSSDAVKRLRPYGLGVSLFANESDEFINYYLDPIDSFKSSNSLETTINEYTSQGLELDYTGVCWGFDFTWSTELNSWMYRKSRASGWLEPKKDEVKQFLKNRYRVLLTRFRYGMVIWIPEGNDNDKTRPCLWVDETFNLLKQLGIKEI